MKIAQQKRNIAVIVLLLLVLTMPCHAMSRPGAADEPKQVDSMEAFFEEYEQGTPSAGLRGFLATEQLLCTGEVNLTGGKGSVDLYALSGGIRVTQGAVLRWNDPELAIMGFPPVITVESGGALILGSLGELAAQAMSLPGSIVIEAGGRLELLDPDGLMPGLVKDLNDTGQENDALPPRFRAGTRTRSRAGIIPHYRSVGRGTQGSQRQAYIYHDPSPSFHG